jgi:hypothetical protein
MLGDLSITPVDPREVGWSPYVLFKKDFKFKITLKPMSWFEAATAKGKFGAYGEEGIDWFSDDDEGIYCKSVLFLIMCRLSDDETFEQLIARIEERTDCDE